MHVPHNKPSFDEKDLLEVERLLRSGELCTGSEVSLLEQDVCAVLGGGACSVTSSGTSSLHLALKGLGLEAGKLVAIPSYSCTALLDAVLMNGADPLVVDIDFDSLCMCPEALTKASSSRIPDGAIYVQNHGRLGFLSDITPQIPNVVLDVCHSFGSPVCLQGVKDTNIEAVVSSFYATKIVSGARGGFIWSKNKRLIDDVAAWRCAQWGPELAPRIGCEMSDIHACLARSQMSRIDLLLKRRQAISNRYIEYLPPKALELFRAHSDGEIYYRFTLAMNSAEQADEFTNFMKQRDVCADRLFGVDRLLHRFMNLPDSQFPNAVAAARTMVSIPNFPAMSDAQVDYTAEVLHEACEELL